MDRDEVIDLIESGIQVGYTEMVERAGSTYSLTVGIQKHAGLYKVAHHFMKIDLEGSPYDDDPDDIWDHLKFESLVEAEKHIVNCSGVVLAKMSPAKPTKGRKNKGFFNLESFY